MAQHGFWNRTEKPEFEVHDDVIGRPVDITEGPDGDLYLSDTAGVYRVTYTEFH